MIFSLTLPPTDNSLRIPIINKKTRRPEIIKSEVYRDWEHFATIQWSKFCTKNKMSRQEDKPTYERQHRYKVTIFMQSKRTDISNFTKAAKDWATDKLYTDDKWVDFHIQLPVLIDSDNPRIEIDLDPEIIENIQ